MPIIDAETRYQDTEKWLGDITLHALLKKKVISAVGQVDHSVKVFARVNHGRWIADCPFCAGAEFVNKSLPVFMCQSCWNEAVKGKWLPVEFPAEHVQIDRELLLRNTENQNWQKGETVERLVIENMEHLKG